ncbi:MAG: glycosyltransferase [Dehalococcoidia bacterium]|nr:glycosyltransferase [Dehalococcoidia bacterium]
MRICLIGEYSGHLDEGMRKLSSQLAEEMSREHEIKALDIGDVYHRQFWKEIRTFSPEIVHYIHGPSIASLVTMKAISLCNRKAKTVVSATHPDLPRPVRGLIRLLKPDLILTQSHDIEQMFIKHGCTTTFLPTGVDTGKFRPVSAAAKHELRKKYGIDEDAFIVLHVGSVRKERNVLLLGDIQESGHQVVLIGSGSTGIEQDVLLYLKKRGCVVRTDYFENVEEIYALSDCYVFPTQKRIASIESPLSVLEAMACNLPVVATPFGALPRLFQPGDGLFFAESKQDIMDSLNSIRSGAIEVNTRQKVVRYDWVKVVSRLEGIYADICSGRQPGAA